MTTSGDHHPTHLIGAVSGILTTAGLVRPHLPTVAARRTVLADVLLGDDVAPRQRSSALLASLCGDVGGAVTGVSAVDGAAQSADLLRRLGFHAAAESVEARHERPDGRGLPVGLPGTALPLGASVLALTDVLVGPARSEPVDWQRRLEIAKDSAGSALDLELTELAYELLQSTALRAQVDGATIEQALEIVEAELHRDPASGADAPTGATSAPAPLDYDDLASIVDHADDPVALATAMLATAAQRHDFVRAGIVTPVAGEERLVALSGLTATRLWSLSGPTVVPTSGGSASGTHVVVVPVAARGSWGLLWAAADARVAAGTMHDLAGIAAVVAAAAARNEQIERLEALAHCDQLTGLSNRWLLEEELAEIFAGSRDRRADAALVMCDVDGLKLVNDTRGHAAGDAVLVMVAGALQRAVDRIDGVATRLGGDEFAILIRSGALLHASQLAHQVRDEVCRLAPPGVGLSCGVAYAAHADTPRLLLGAADEAQYSMKRRTGPRHSAGGLTDAERRANRR